MTKSTKHIRRPQRADAVAGKKQQSGITVPPQSVPDPRTVSQEPGKKPNKVKKEEAAIIAELDQGPLVA
jgi:hypothetical protein